MVGHDVGDEDRCGRWGGDERDVRVPTRVAATAIGVELEDLRVVGMAGHDRMGGRWLAEPLRQRDLLGVRQVLIAQHDNPMFGEQRREPRRIESVVDPRPGQLDAEHAGDRSDRPVRDVLAHVCSSVTWPTAARNSRHTSTNLLSLRRS